MRISKFIARLEELRAVAGADVEVAIPVPEDKSDYNSAVGIEYEMAAAELCNVGKTGPKRWLNIGEDNTEQIVSVW